MHGHLSWLVELDIKEGKLEEASALIDEMVEHTSKEAFTHTYDWYISADKKTAAGYERYNSPEEAHTHLKGFLATFVDRFVEVFDATRMVVYGTPTDELAADIEGWGPTYLEYWGGFRR